ncbi:MAG: hypothetical protein JJU37_16105 [Balneolaceae bacterium]|nr:hypothetical protein [Balneolaceae bacterium]
MAQNFEYGKWALEYDLQDGARIGKLSYAGTDLVTTEPETFKAPETDYGLYETRPVYGYDDCLPSVEQSNYPGRGWEIPDHGELCWLSWNLEVKSNQLIFSVESRELPIQFKRVLEFDESTLVWKFEVINTGDTPLPFQHVIHPLIPLNDVTDIELPEFDSVHNDRGEEFHLKNPGAVQDFLLNVLQGDFYMLFVQGAKRGEIGWTYSDRLKVRMNYPLELFPAIGIWWNNSGYPDEDGCRRNECAFEPIPGRSSTLIDAHHDGLALIAKPGEPFSWEITWDLKII